MAKSVFGSVDAYISVTAVPLSGSVPRQLIHRIARFLPKKVTERQASATRKKR